MILSSIQNSAVAKDSVATLLFGLLSAALGLLTLNTPGFEGSYSDLREIGLLLCLFHLSNPLFIIPLCLLSLLGLPFEIRLVPIFGMHVIPLFINWYLYKWIEKKHWLNIGLGLIWFIVAILYYLIFLYPLLIVSYQWAGINTGANFKASYDSLFKSGMFEMITTALISSLYLIQLNIRRSLELTNKNLEKIVSQRTEELTDANQKLYSLNQNLEQIVEERTKKMNAQLDQILKYAHMNSHEVRAPLARILGLMNLIKNETNETVKKDLLEKLDASSLELDVVVRKMNRLLEGEITSNE
jgi:hypothetical protein